MAIKKTKPTETTETTVEKKDEIVAGVVTNCDKLNIRKAAKEGDNVLMVADASTELQVNLAQSTKDFYKICTASGIEGFCMKKFIELK